LESYKNQNPCWVFLAAQGDDEFARFCKVAGRDDIARDSRFATRAAREKNDHVLAQALEAVLRTLPAKEWETKLLAVGVGCVMADEMSHFAFLYRDPQARAIDMMSVTEHSAFGGRYSRHAPLLRFSATPGHGGPFCEFGEHTRAILTELGYGQATMAQLAEAGVVMWREERIPTNVVAA
jgi:crotonobetainyl-CoA:carnitine CoA-transferase CaiB-like acyl-CoA transferase